MISQLIILFYAFLKVHGSIQTDTFCEEGWLPYKDEKCIKVFSDDFIQFSAANNFCNAMGLGSSLLSIKNTNENAHYYKYIFNSSKIENNVWLGAKGTNGTFTWPDGSPLDYTNWATGNKKFENDTQCVEFSPTGKWLIVSCKRRNLFICEKHQIWSVYKIQTILQQVRKEQIENPVPKGFLYVQLSNQPDPQILWPTVAWKQVTKEYVGLFFRAEGSGSVFNGPVQEENSPRLTAVYSRLGRGVDNGYISIVRGGTSGELTTGDDVSSGNSWLTKFTHSGGEVRPRNKAIRIWKRIL